MDLTNSESSFSLILFKAKSPKQYHVWLEKWLKFLPKNFFPSYEIMIVFAKRRLPFFFTNLKIFFKFLLHYQEEYRCQLEFWSWQRNHIDGSVKTRNPL